MRCVYLGVIGDAWAPGANNKPFIINFKKLKIT